ncbi:MAG: hypothetical protein DHS20C11_25510 [Lysobacteraceae bacterium]|nr:MAG: hypothetical protein DHS20C11_25510 [Xanthomonadaceae bacterium]
MKPIHFVLLLAVSPLAAAQTATQWLAAEPGDLVAPANVTVKAALPSLNDEQAPVSFEQTLDRRMSISAPTPHRASSRQFWLETDGAALKAGLSVPTTAKGSLIRISSARNAGKATALDSSQLWLNDGAKVLTDGAGIKALADGEALQAAAPFPENTLAFKLDDSIAAGMVKVGTFQSVDDQAKFVVHVFEPNSDKTAELMMEQNGYFSGQTFKAQLALKGITADRKGINGFAVSPSGEMVDLKFTANGEQWSAVGTASDEPGMWEVHVFANGTTKAGNAVIRNIRIPVAITAPTARLMGQASGNAQALSVALSVDVAGRYAIRGVLYGTDAQGQMVPASGSESARWLTPGQHTIALTFAAQSIDGLTAPFELRHLQLLDQSRMGVLHSQQRAARLIAHQDFR